MKFLILNTDYPEFLRWLYAQHPGLENAPYEEQMRVRMKSLFGMADFYSSNLRKLGHEAWDIFANNEFMQKAWAREHGMPIEKPMLMGRRVRTILQQARRIAAKTPLRYLKPLFRPVWRSLDSQQSWFYDILAAQIKNYKPDVLLNQAMDGINSRFMRQMKPYVQLLVGQIASPLPQGEDFGCYDLVISSLPNFVEYFLNQGIRSELHRLGFGTKVLEMIDPKDNKTLPISFVGNLSYAHEERVRLLEHLCKRFDNIRIWGKGIESLPQDSPTRQHYMGQAWGKEMYQILCSSKVTLNCHGKWSGEYANNCRLYEATGVGTLLITDWKVNLHKMFEIGKEVVAYRSPEECSELIQYYLEHDDEREAIACAGQQRTLREHTYYQRMQELVEIVRKYL